MQPKKTNSSNCVIFSYKIVSLDTIKKQKSKKKKNKQKQNTNKQIKSKSNSIMSDVNTTNIHDLPTDASIGGNVSLGVEEIHKPHVTTLDQSSISQIVNGLQQASLAGATQLPSRDIPIQTGQLTTDAQIQPNYIPQPGNENRDYIKDQRDDIAMYYQDEKNQSSLDILYDEIQAPLLLSVLYFLFQLPFFKRAIFKYLPFFCNNDGNYNFNGFMFTCALFGFIYYALTKTVHKFSKF